MAIEITNNTLLKQCPSSPPHPLSNTIVSLTIFDLAAYDIHVPTIYAFKPPMPSNEALKEGLSKVLVNYPHLSGRLTTDEFGKQCCDLNDAGIRLIETKVSATLAEKLPLEATTELSTLFPSVQGVKELLQIQLNRYECGGLAIGATCHHRVSDGHSMSQFFLAWAETVRGCTTITLPFHDRSTVAIPRNPPFCEFNHKEFEPKKPGPITKYCSNAKTSNIKVHFSPEFVKKLKSKVPGKSSTFECLLAHLWKKITIARGLDDDESTNVRIAVNGRARIKPSVPMEYFGNLVLYAFPTAQVRKLTHANQAEIVKIIHDEVSRIDDRFFKSFIDYGELTKEEVGRDEKLQESAPGSGSSMCPNLDVTSWLRFNFHELDFGSGGPCASLPPNLPIEGLMVFVPSCEEEGAVDVFLALFDEHVDLFNEICYLLD